MATKLEGRGGGLSGRATKKTFFPIANTLYHIPFHLDFRLFMKLAQRKLSITEVGKYYYSVSFHMFLLSLLGVLEPWRSLAPTPCSRQSSGSGSNRIPVFWSDPDQILEKKKTLDYGSEKMKTRIRINIY